MKKLFFSIVILVLLGSTNVFAQASFGIKAGINLANLEGEQISNNEAVIKLHAGAYVNVLLSEKFSLQPELLYQGMGTRAKSTESGINGSGVSYTETYDYRVRMNYIAVPVMMKYNFTTGFYGELGPQVAVALSQKVKYTYHLEETGSLTIDESGNVNMDDEDQFGEDVQKIDFAIGLGLGYQLTNGLHFGARYNFSINHVVDAGNSDEDIKNSVFMIGLGYTFNP